MTDTPARAPRSAALHHSGETMWWTNGERMEITLDPEDMEIGVPFAYSMAGEWYVALKVNEEGSLRIYSLPKPRPSFREWLRRILGGAA